MATEFGKQDVIEKSGRSPGLFSVKTNISVNPFQKGDICDNDHTFIPI